MADIHAGGTRIFLRPDGVLQVVGLERRKQTVADAKAVITALRNLAGSRRVQLLLDLTVTAGLENDARDYYNEQAREFATAVAIVTSSTIGRVIANFIMATNEGVLPVRLFNDESAALEWLGRYPSR